MQQHLVLWGFIGTDRKVLLAIYLVEEENQVKIHAFPKEIVDKNLQDQLFAWKNGAPFKFPESELIWHIDAYSDSILPRDIRVEKPEFIQRAQLSWGKLLMSSKLFKVCKEEIVFHKTLVSSTPVFKQEQWDKTQELWQKYSDMLKSQDIVWEQAELLKAEINETFDFLKANKKKAYDKEKSQVKEISKKFEKEIDAIKSQLIYPEEWPKIHEKLKVLQADLKSSAIRFQNKKPLFEKIDEIYQSLKSYKKTQNITHTKDRLGNLQRILKGLETSLEKDVESFTTQQEKLSHYTKGKNSGSEWTGLLQVIQNRIKEKEAKVEDIKKTIQQLESKIAKEIAAKKDSTSKKEDIDKTTE
jgi:hypothetical protein